VNTFTKRRKKIEDREMKSKVSPQMQTSAVVITGTPGTGKTTISKSLARRLDADYLSLSKLILDKKLYAAVDQRRRTKVVNPDRTRAWLRKSLRKIPRLTILDTHLADVIPQENVVKVVVLRCHPKILEARLRKKGWRVLKVRENVLAEILDSCYVIAAEYYGTKKTVQLDTSRTSVSATVNQCIAILQKQVPRKLTVDWIAVLNRERSLERYLR